MSWPSRENESMDAGEDRGQGSLGREEDRCSMTASTMSAWTPSCDVETGKGSLYICIFELLP